MINLDGITSLKLAYTPLDVSLGLTNKIISDRRKGLSYGLKTSFTKLDKVLGEWQFGNYYCIAGRPGTGKSAFLNLVLLDLLEMNADKKLIVLYFNFEMSNWAQDARFLSAKTGFTTNDILSIGKNLTEDEAKKVQVAQQELDNLNIVYIDNILTPDRIEKIIHTVVEDNPDYQVICALDHSRMIIKPKGMSEMDSINELSKVFVRTKKELNVLNILLSQLNRNIESNERRKDYFRPLLSDIYGADSIGQDIETAIMLYRPEMYDIKDVNGIPTQDKLFLELPKNRNGAVGVTVALNHDLAINKLTEL